ncbi:hypothetical protein [Streptomyces melanogenes]|uniref:Uncharacterized protein n=1 Tax=Streptomyces melanogenes TaxID=67326 RepID=A0ABZ1XMM7_9ACTN|nr:hypothetical protein [Streptomyces melanogenes]
MSDGGSPNSAAGGNPDLAAPKQALASITAGINDCLGELKDIGMVGLGSVGRGFTALEVSGLDMGHEGLTSEFKTFCERWEWGVRALVQEGNRFAADVGLSAGMLHEQDQYLSGSLKTLVNSVNGNPNLSEEEIAKKGWGDVLTQSPIDNADYSSDSFEQAHEDVKRTVHNSAYDVQAGIMDHLADYGVIDEQTRARVDEVSRETMDPDQAVLDRAHWERERR